MASPPHLLLLLLLAACVGVVYGYGNGQISAACGSQTPGHGANGQTSAAPYTVTAGKSSFSPGDAITVTLQAKQTGFMGFLLQARQVGSTTAIGTFAVTTSSAQLLSCNGAKTAVSHTSSSTKSSIQATWTAPTSGPLGNIQFSVTFLQSYSTFWVGVKSATVTYNASTTSGTTTGTTTTTTPTTTAAVWDPSCGTSKVCFSQPSNCNPATTTGCYFVSAQMSPDQSKTRIEIAGQLDGYVAIGFSDDQTMGNDDVYICGKDRNGLIQVQHAFTTGKTSPTILALGNVTNIVTSATNGILNCSFTTANAISTGSRAASTSQYYLMIAAGPSSQGNIQFHTNKFVSSTKADLLNPTVVGSSAEAYPAIVKAHGCLMLIAWMTTGSIGMLIARYFKGVAKETRCCGKDFWFIAHVTLMSLSICSTAIAFILIFSFAQDWSGGAHPVLGCLVMILSLLQPTVAAFRCGPHDEKRFIFNWAHSFIALGLKGLAVAAIFTGLALFEGDGSDGWMLQVMGGFIAWEAIMYVLQDLNRRSKRKGSSLCSFGSMSTEVFLLLLFLLGNLAFLIALLVGIGST